MNVIKDNKGITLIEILVSVSLFSVMMLSVLGIFNFILEDQRNSISSQNIQEGVRYALEMMAKEIRAVREGADCSGLGVLDVNTVFNSQSPSELRFKNKYGVCTTYSLVGDRIQITRGGISEFLTGNKVKVANLRFDIKDNDVGTIPGSKIQPKVTILMDLETTIGKTAAGNKIKIQTTISARIYE